MSYETAVQTVVFDALSGSTALNAIVSGVYDSVPQQATFPYVTIGEHVHNEWDTGTTIGSTASITIHTWTRGRGRKETKEIQGIIYDTLHRANLSISGYNIDTIEFENSQSFMDADGLTRHGVQTFRILIERT